MNDMECLRSGEVFLNATIHRQIQSWIGLRVLLYTIKLSLSECKI